MQASGTQKTCYDAIRVLGGAVLSVFRIAFVCVFSFSAAAVAEDVSLSTQGRLKLFKNQTSVLDGRAAQQYAHSARLLPKRSEPERVPRYRGRYSGPYLAAARAAAQRNNVPVNLFLRLIEQESGWKAGAISHKGAVGLAQLMPQTARALGVNPSDPVANLDGGARYLRAQYEAFGSWRLALAAYNAGPGAVTTHKGVPPYAETRKYVTAILGR